MKILGIALMLIFSLAASAQDASQTAKTASGKTIRLAGAMTNDGPILLRDSEGKVWTLSNPEMLQTYHGEEVVIRGQLMPESHEVRVVSVKPVKKQYVANWGDSAFRR